MPTRAGRRVLVLLLLITGFGAAYMGWRVQARVSSALEREQAADVRLDRMAVAIASLTAAQAAYVAPGQPRADWLARAASDLAELEGDAEILARDAATAAVPSAARSFAAAFASVARIDARAREHLRIGHELMAADLLYSEARQGIDAMAAAVIEMRQAERDRAQEERSALKRDGVAVLAAWALVWAAGIIGLAREAKADPRAAELPKEGPAVAPEATPETGEHAGVNLTEAAAVCADLSRLASAESLPALLDRGARALGASGLIVWLGAGEELFAATAYGYGPGLLGRLGPLRRHDENAAAAAWRTGEPRIVGGDGAGKGAIVAPLVGRDGCVGVLTVEVPEGRERDAAVRAVASMIAAQLASIIVAWPAPSEAGRLEQSDASTQAATA